jgi:hypothetical protein
VFRYPTLRSMTEHVRTLLDARVAPGADVASGAADHSADDAAPDRGARRRAARQRP